MSEFDLSTARFHAIDFEVCGVCFDQWRCGVAASQGQRKVLTAFRNRDTDEVIAVLNTVTPAADKKQRPVTTIKRAGKSYASLLEKCETDDKQGKGK